MNDIIEPIIPMKKDNNIRFMADVDIFRAVVIDKIITIRIGINAVEMAVPAIMSICIFFISILKIKNISSKIMPAKRNTITLSKPVIPISFTFRVIIDPIK